MAVRIRFSRLGKKNTPVFRIVAVDGRKKRDGAFLEDLGTYNPVTHQLVRFNPERLQYWISQGAIPTDSVKRVAKMHKEQKKSA